MLNTLTNRTKTLLLVGLLLTLGACAQGARSTQMVPMSAMQAQAPYHGPQFNVGHVGGGEETNPLWTSQVDSASFAQALRDTLSINGMLAQQGSPLTLTANLEALDQPFMGLDLTVTSRVRYTITDPQGGVVVSELVTGTGTGTTGDAFMAVERLRLANEKSIQDNLRKLVTYLRGLQWQSAPPPAGSTGY